MADSKEPRAESLERIEEAAQTRATELNLSNLGLSELPPEIGTLTILTTLYLHGNQLTALSPEIGKLTNLTELVLMENQLTALPPEIVKLANLTSLDLMRNQLTALPPEIGKLTNLTSLSVWRNRLTGLPPDIGKLTNLTSLNLVDNQLTTLPPEIGKLTNLTRLDLSGNQLTALPPEIGKLTNLTRLDLSGNQLTALPPEIGKLTNLTSLYLVDNQLTTLPPEIGKLTKLTSLGLWHNRLTALPPEIVKLTNLTSLYLGGNRLTALPPEIVNLTNLTRLDLRGNQLTALPPEIGKLTKLTSLNIDRNPLPAEILRLAKENKLIAYLHELAAKGEQAHPFNEAKLLLIGPGEVGKTWLLQALQGKVPQPTESTKGIEITRQPLDIPHPTEKDRVIHFNCWDFGGQDNYQVTHQIFFSPKAIYLLVWKPRPGVDPDLFARLERIELSAGRTAKVFIVSTHADGPVPAVVGEQAIRERFQGLIGGFFKVDTPGDPRARALPRCGKRLPKRPPHSKGWTPHSRRPGIEASAAIRKLDDTTLPFDRFATVCNACGLNADSTESLAIVLDVQGHVVYFSEAASSGKAGVTGAENLVVLNPEWLAKAVAMVIVDEPTIKRSGELKHERLPVIWKEHTGCCTGPENCLCGYLLWLMWKFDIAYRLNEQTSLVPEMIARNRPDDLRWTPMVQSKESQATLIARIPHSPPLGLVPVFTTAVHPLRRRDKGDDPWDRNWRNGFFLDTARRGPASWASGSRFANDGERYLSRPSASPVAQYFARGAERSLAQPQPGLSHSLLGLCGR